MYNVILITIKRVIHNPTDRFSDMGRFAPAHKKRPIDNRYTKASQYDEHTI